VPVAKIDKTAIADGKLDPVTGRIQEEFKKQTYADAKGYCEK
jgi:hypothetical protein